MTKDRLEEIRKSPDLSEKAKELLQYIEELEADIRGYEAEEYDRQQE